MKKIFIIAVSLFFINTGYSQEIKKVKIAELEKIIAETKTPLIVNFWATWCKPCIEEMPYFLEEYTNHKKDSLQLLLVSFDFKDEFQVKVAQFVEKRKVTAPVVWLDETNADIFCPRIDSAWDGAIPASLFINPKTGYRKFYQEQLTHAQLKKEIMAILVNSE